MITKKTPANHGMKIISININTTAMCQAVTNVEDPVIVIYAEDPAQLTEGNVQFVTVREDVSTAAAMENCGIKWD